MCQEIQLETLHIKGAFHTVRVQRILTRANKYSCIEFAQRAIATDNGYLLTKIHEIERRSAALHSLSLNSPFALS